jgi:hypothetical protein
MALSGVITVTTAGTEVRGTNQPGNAFMIKALPSNTGYIYVGNNGDDTVGSGSGYWLSAGDYVPMFKIGNLNQILFDSSVDGEKACWLLIE